MTENARPASLLTFVCVAALLGVSILVSRLHLGPLRIVIVLLLAAGQGLLVLLNFMRARLSSPLIWVAAAAGFLWLGILFSLALSDYLTRPVTW
jgi:cytochrome c oxidase subunit IV